MPMPSASICLAIATMSEAKREAPKLHWKVLVLDGALRIFCGRFNRAQWHGAGLSGVRTRPGG